jgi:histidyl-tRNA synthetase
MRFACRPCVVTPSVRVQTILQVKAFDVDVVEACPHKGSLEVASTLRALLEGSRQVNTKKGGAGALPAVADVPTVHGAAVDALAAAAAPVRAVLATAALPAGKDGAPRQAGSPALCAALLAAAPAMLRAARLSLERCTAVVERLADIAGPAFDSAPDAAMQQRGLSGVLNLSKAAFDAAQQRVAAVAGRAALADGPPPSLAASEATYGALRVLQQAVQAEALAAVVSLRLQEGPVEAAAAPPPPLAASEPADGGAPADGKKKKKEKEKRGGGGGGSGLTLGKGTALLRASLEHTAAASVCAAAGPAAAGGGLEACLLSLSLQDGTSVSLQLQAAGQAIADHLQPVGAALGQTLAALAAVVEANAARRKPKIAKGARDFLPDQMAIREEAFSKIVAVFKRHGAVSIDTPVFELRETLTGKYGEDSKLIYDLADQGGEALSLRYDLTVPFARYVALHGVTNIKRYHIAKVYRRDQPQMARGRFREFSQCDFDVAGAYATMVADAEVIKVLVEILTDLQLGQFTVKLNHRGLLDAVMALAGVPPQKFRPICSAIDKLDKEPWAAVRAEMVDDKGLPPAAADRIGELVQLRGAPRALLAELCAEGQALGAHPGAAAALAELRILFDFLDDMGALGPVSFDLSLARGLDYYTGVIYEAVLEGAAVGSIAAGGRYDGLVGMFSGKEVPAVGVSIGIERVFAIVEGRLRAEAAAAGGTIRDTETQVLVASIGAGMQGRRMRVAAALWAAGVKAEFGFKPNPKMGDQLGAALKGGVPFMVLFGEDEVSRGVVKFKDLDAGTEEEVAEAALPALARARADAKGERRVVFAPREAQ